MRFDSEKKIVFLSVRELCDYALMRGNLDFRVSGKNRERLMQGQEAHRLLQKESGPNGHAEVTVCSRVTYQKRTYEISGRADIVIDGKTPIVEEIKSVTNSGSREPSAYHIVQANLTAWLYLRMHQFPEVCVRKTIFQTETGEKKTYENVYGESELEKICNTYLSAIEYRVKYLEEHQTALLPTARVGRFPYASVRDSQNTMLRECYRDMKHNKRLFIQAPTGVGKTISALFPAVRLLGEGNCDRIFYLTAKSSTSREAYRAATDIYKAGTLVKTVVLTSRENLCLNQAAKTDPAGITRHCNPNDCPYAKGFFDRCKTAVGELINHQSGFPRKTILDVAKARNICPYEFQLELSEFCDIIICDYNYVFDPMVYLRRYFEENAPQAGRFLFLVDEAHNLSDRASSMYSEELTYTPIRMLYENLKNTHSAPKHVLETMLELLKAFQKAKSYCRDTLVKDEMGFEKGYYLNHGMIPGFFETVSACREVMENLQRKHYGNSVETETIQFLSLLKRFETIASYFDSHFITFVSVKDGEISVRIICLDPSEILKERFSLSEASVAFSATLTPLDYFADILGGGKEALKVELPSPYQRKNLCVVAATGVSTRFEDREQSVKKIASIIAATVSAKTGNYITYFPSYQYLETVYKRFTEKNPNIPVVLQTRQMTPQQKEQFLEAFRDDGRLRIGFCVLGGSFSEGVDLAGGRLIGSIIVGVGLPGISDERNILRDYYENTRERGFDYAYTFPGMNRVLQAAGRVIRSETDRGIIVLADDRWEEPRYQQMIPDQWKHLQYAKKSTEIANIANIFWKNR